MIYTTYQNNQASVQAPIFLSHCKTKPQTHSLVQENPNGCYKMVYNSVQATRLCRQLPHFWVVFLQNISCLVKVPKQNRLGGMPVMPCDCLQSSEQPTALRSYSFGMTEVFFQVDRKAWLSPVRIEISFKRWNQIIKGKGYCQGVESSSKMKNIKVNVTHHGNRDVTWRLPFRECTFLQDKVHRKLGPFDPGNDSQDISGRKIYRNHRNGRLDSFLNNGNRYSSVMKHCPTSFHSVIILGVFLGFFSGQYH